MKKKRNFLVILEKQSLWFKILIALLLIIVVGILDFLTGYQLSFSLFYLLPIIFVTWFINAKSGIITSIFSAIIWFLADTLSRQNSCNDLIPFIPFWNMMIRLGFFIIVTLLLSEIIKLLEIQKKLNRIDSKTGAFNSAFFYELLENEINRSQRYKHSFAIVYFDLDNFKTVNDQYGHLEGDRVLYIVVNCIQNNLRKVDIIARLGGDEFALLLPEINLDSAQIVLSELRNSLLTEMQRYNWAITFSFGGIIFNCNSSLTVEELINVADELMYDVKRDGKNAMKWKEV